MKVTDEMVERAVDAYVATGSDDHESLKAAIQAALETALKDCWSAKIRVEDLEDAHDELYSQFAVMETRALRAEACVKELQAKLEQVRLLAFSDLLDEDVVDLVRAEFAK